MITVPGCYNTDGTPAQAYFKNEIVRPKENEGVAQPTPAQGARNVQKNLAENVDPAQQPGVL